MNKRCQEVQGSEGENSERVKAGRGSKGQKVRENKTSVREVSTGDSDLQN